MPIAKEILSMFEFSRSEKKHIFQISPLSQQRSVPTVGTPLELWNANNVCLPMSIFQQLQPKISKHIGSKQYQEMTKVTLLCHKVRTKA